MKSKILFFILFFIYFSSVAAENISIEAKNISIDKKK